jgi:ATP-dependent Clp protease ATP-binding subunit ClpC
MTIEVTEKFKEHLIQVGYDPSYGARPMRRAVMSLLEDALAEAMLSGILTEGHHAIVDMDEQGKVKVSPAERQPEDLSEYAVTTHR